jgi:hypothetical protein
MVRQHSSNPPNSSLAELFAQRCGFQVANPEDAMRQLADRLRGDGSNAGLDDLLPIRGIDRDVAIVEQLPCDGIIEPKGCTYADGFSMRLRQGQTERRLRFTKAHEICHTFFYELVPEFKFRLHTTDPCEEWLCNVGAEELLMPLPLVKAEAASRPVSIESLESLATRFNVSHAAMLLRLRQARLWHCELAYWHRMVDGAFSLDTKIGGRKANWQIDSSILRNAWGSAKTESGVAFIYFEQRGLSAAERVYYQARRRGTSIMMLWGKHRFTRREKLPPLLRIAKASKKQDVTR